MTDRITLLRPDDWHIHLRDGAVLTNTVADVARTFGRAIIMPNLVPPVRNAAEACLLYTSPSPRDLSTSRMPSSA